MDNWEDCYECPLALSRKGSVKPRGGFKRKVMFVGEAPGADEESQGKAFVGASGKMLNQWIDTLGLSEDDVYITNVVKCVDGQTQVRLADGSHMRIDHMVKTEYDGEVLTVNQLGEFETRPVIGWYRTPLANRKVYRMTFKHRKNNPRGYAGVTLTEDHPVKTESGWIQVSKLKAGDKIATGDPAPGLVALQIILGSLLGDGTITRSYFAVSHSLRQKEWLELKARTLGTPVREFDTKVGSVIHRVVSMRTPSSSYWRWLRDEFYVGGRKVVPKWLKKNWSDMTLATWYLDDGYYDRKRRRAHFATYCFSQKDVEYLQNILMKNGIHCWVCSKPPCYYEIICSIEGTRALAQKIGQMVPPSLRYKLPLGKWDAYEPRKYDPSIPRVFFDEVCLDKGKASWRMMYCIDVERTHCFITHGGVVHNCRPPNNRDPTEFEIQGCIPHLAREIQELKPGLIIPLGRFAKDVVSHLRDEGTITAQQYGVALRHPAWYLRKGGRPTEELQYIRRRLENERKQEV